MDGWLVFCIFATVLLRSQGLPWIRALALGGLASVVIYPALVNLLGGVVRTVLDFPLLGVLVIAAIALGLRHLIIIAREHLANRHSGPFQNF